MILTGKIVKCDPDTSVTEMDKMTGNKNMFLPAIRNGVHFIMLINTFIVITCFCAANCIASAEHPCKFFHRRNGNIVQCEDEFPGVKSLNDSLENITENVTTFALHSLTLDILPQDIFTGFKNAKIKKIIFSRVSLELLLIPENGASPFESIKDTLENFEVYDSFYVFGWDFSVLNTLTNLRTLIIENSDVVEFSHAITLKSLRFLQIINADLKWVNSNVLREADNITICSFANNLLKEVKRTMFPLPADKLWSLDFSYNKLKSLPKNIFSEMDSLRELKLDYNELKYMDGSIFEPVWSHLSQLWLDGNKEVCWVFCWAADEENRPLFMDSSRCYLKRSILLDSFYRFCK